MPAMRSSELLDRARRSCPRRCAFSSRATS
jgi:hypothetical protein